MWTNILLALVAIALVFAALNITRLHARVTRLEQQAARDQEAN